MISGTANVRHELYQTQRLRDIYDENGIAAFDRAAVGLLFLAAALIAKVEGNHRLGDLIDEVGRMHPRPIVDISHVYLDFSAMCEQR